MPIIIASESHEVPDRIHTQTSRKSDIENEQYSIVTRQAVDTEKNFQPLFGIGSAFQGDETAIYNCHGLTFTNKRTGVFNDKAIELIIKDEYREIKLRDDVIVGDIAIYYNDGLLTHSSIVVDINKKNGFLSIRVLSKTRSYKEIVHFIDSAPPVYGNEKKFYRIRHAPITIV